MFFKEILIFVFILVYASCIVLNHWKKEIDEIDRKKIIGNVMASEGL